MVSDSGSFDPGQGEVRTATREQAGAPINRSGPDERTGWVTFSAVILIVAGIMRVLDAVWAFRYNGAVVDDLHQALFGHSLTAYGWIWLIVGGILIASGFFLLSPTTTPAHVSRWIGIVASAIAAISAVSWLPYYPVWSLVYIGIAVAVIYGLSAHFHNEPATRTTNRP